MGKNIGRRGNNISTVGRILKGKVKISAQWEEYLKERSTIPAQWEEYWKGRTMNQSPNCSAAVRTGPMTATTITEQWNERLTIPAQWEEY